MNRREEMIELLADEEYFEATFNTLPEVIAVNQTSQTKLQQTIAIARMLIWLACDRSILG
jgi:hypothetical protein